MTVKSGNQLKSIAVGLALGGGCLAIAGLAYLFLMPKSYQAAARIKIIDWVHTSDLGNPSDLSVIAAECAMLRSNALTDQVIQNLHLADAWGKRYQQGAALTAEQARDRYNSETFVEPLADSTLIDIRVRSEDREETAKIANELAQVYRDLRDSQRQELIRQRLGALKQSWLEQNQKLSNAQAQVEKLYFDISEARETNQIRVYDPDSFASNRVEVETEYAAQSNELAGFKCMDKDTLKQVLSSMDTNSTLTPLISKWNKAKSDWLNAKLEHGADARETKDAALAVDQLDQAITRQIAGILLVKENNLAGLKSWLDEMNAKMKTPTAAELERATSQYAKYTNALQNRNQLTAERETLEANMRAAESKEAIVPTGVTVDLIDSAETPRRPYIPNGDLCLGILAAGGLFALVGLVVGLVGQRQAAK